MSKFKVWLLIYIIIGSINLNISYADNDVIDMKIAKTEKVTEISK